jgi:hypothetical protein
MCATDRARDAQHILPPDTFENAEGHTGSDPVCPLE